MKSDWKVITHLVYSSLSNKNTVEWELIFSRYTNEERKTTKGPILGYLDKNGKIQVLDPKKHKILYGVACEEYYPEDCGTMIWLENQEADK